MEEKTEFDLQVKMSPRSRGAPGRVSAGPVPGAAVPRSRRRDREFARHKRWKLDDGSPSSSGGSSEPLRAFHCREAPREPESGEAEVCARALPLSVVPPGRDGAQAAERRHRPGHGPRLHRRGARSDAGSRAAAAVPGCRRDLPGARGGGGGRRRRRCLRFTCPVRSGHGGSAPPSAPGPAAPALGSGCSSSPARCAQDISGSGAL